MLFAGIIAHHFLHVSRIRVNQLLYCVYNITKTNNLKFHQLTANCLTCGSEMWITKKEWTRLRVDCVYSGEILHTGVRCDLWKHTENEPRQVMYVYRNMEARSCDHCCSGKAMSITHQSVCICSSRYPACNEHGLYCHLWLVWLYHIFPHYLINDKTFLKKLPNTKCVF